MDDSTTRTDVLQDLRSDSRESFDRLVPIVYGELRRMAHRHLAGPRGTLSTTALVHEAYLKLVDQGRAQRRDRSHFLALASLAMRHILVDRAEAHATVKRGGNRKHVSLDDEEIGVEDQPEAILELNEALDRLAAVEPRLARVVECRFFGGLSEMETAEALSVTTRTIHRDWVKARLLLRRVLQH
jgi:RNA polymerase sigma factor (TIGR02999 family)